MSKPYATPLNRKLLDFAILFDINRLAAKEFSYTYKTQDLQKMD
jgi:hypothetical protein